MSEPCPAGRNYQKLYYRMVRRMAAERAERVDICTVECPAKRFTEQIGMEQWEQDVAALADFLYSYTKLNRAIRKVQKCEQALVDEQNREKYMTRESENRERQLQINVFTARHEQQQAAHRITRIIEQHEPLLRATGQEKIIRVLQPQ